MGQLIPWPKPEDRPARPAIERPEGRVLLFLGVRYERDDDAARQAPPRPDRPQRRRKRG